jgi:7-cyano-7-deazaguanine synthase in queuosine biosynthesis
MPRHEHLILCGGVELPGNAGERSFRLNLHGSAPNVRLKIADISKRLVANIPDVLVDLLEVASYVYAADGAVSRGGMIDTQMGGRWRRNFRLIIPVRRSEIWGSPTVSSALVAALSFLSDDDYAFEFKPIENPPDHDRYFEFSSDDASGFTPDEVILFSGGLDSFAGAIEELSANGKSVALVSHRSASKIAPAQRRLIDVMRSRVGGGGRVMHIPVRANIKKSLTRERTHRTRSFLFAALGAVTARLLKLNRIEFFENGVVSLNLPPVAQVVGARATRTTHPQALHRFRNLLSALFGRGFDVVNPFAWMTKAEVVARIAANGFGGLIRDTRSCTRVHDMTIYQPHCGHCSQCVDRRFAVFAAGQEHEDPSEAYKVDLFTGERPPGPDREMALAYVRSATEVSKMDDVAFLSRYGEVSRALAYFSQPADRVARQIFDLHRRHAAAVCNAFDRTLKSHVSDLREGTLPATCLLALVVAQPKSTSVVTEYPAPVEGPGKTDTTHFEVRIATDPDHGRVLLDRWGEIRGVNAKLLIFLADTFRQATKDELAPERYPFTRTHDLLEKLEIDSEETLRRRVFRCRKQIELLATNSGDALPQRTT